MTDVNKLLDELLEGKKPEEILGNEGVLQALTKRLVERALEGEMTAHLGYEKHAAGAGGSGKTRNGKTGKRVLGSFGEVEIAVPRDRDASFTPHCQAQTPESTCSTLGRNRSICL